MPNFQDLAPAIETTVPRPLSPSAPRTLRPANEVLDEVTRLTHLDSYNVRNGVVAAFDGPDPDSTPKARGGRNGSNKKDVDFGKVVSQVADLVKAYDLLHVEFDLRSKAATMFVQEVARPGVAGLVEVGEEVWSDIHDLVKVCREGSEDGLIQAGDEVDRLLTMFGVMAEIREYIWPGESGIIC